MKKTTLKELKENEIANNKYFITLKSGIRKRKDLYQEITICSEINPIHLFTKEYSEIINGYDNQIDEHYYLIFRNFKFYIIEQKIKEEIRYNESYKILYDYFIFEVDEKNLLGIGLNENNLIMEMKEI